MLNGEWNTKNTSKNTQSGNNNNVLAHTIHYFINAHDFFDEFHNAT